MVLLGVTTPLGKHLNRFVFITYMYPSMVNTKQVYTNPFPL